MSSRNGIKFESIRQFLLLDTALSVAASLLSFLFVCWLSRPISGLWAVGGLWLGQALVGSLAGWFILGLWNLEYRHMAIHSWSRLAGSVAVKEAFAALFLILGIIRLPNLQSCVLAVVLDTVFTIFLLFISHQMSIIRHQKRHAEEKNTCQRTALVLGTNEESVALAVEAEKLGRYKVVGFLSTEKALDRTLVGDRPVYWFHDAYDMNTLFWRLHGIDNILVPQEWDAAFRGAAKPRDAVTFHEESWKKYLMMLNAESRS